MLKRLFYFGLVQDFKEYIQLLREGEYIWFHIGGSFQGHLKVRGDGKPDSSQNLLITGQNISPEMKLLNIPDLQMEKLGDVPWKVHERSSPWQITRNESFDQKPRRTSGKLPASACRTKAPYNPPLPSCANPPLRIPQIGPLPASVPNHSPAKVRSANTKLPAAHNVWKCRDFAGNKARVSGCQST